MINQRRAFGERLRRHREKQHVTLDQIAASTKVAASLFAGLEKGDCSRWPGGMYNRSFIRAYASAVRLDPDDAASEFAECYNVPSEPPPSSSPAATREEGPAASFALRLKLDVDPEELRRRAARRAILATGDVLVVVAMAGVVALAAGITYWAALATFSILYQVSVRLLSGVSPAERLLTRRRFAVLTEPAQQAGEDAPVGGTASTVA